MKKILLTAALSFSFACTPAPPVEETPIEYDEKDPVALCEEQAACSDDEGSEAELARCLEEVTAQSNYTNEACDAFLVATQEFVNCMGATAVCVEGQLQSLRCGDEFEAVFDETQAINGIDCEG